MNRLTQALAKVCSEKLLHEKWLIAPSRRVGQQWLEVVTRSGQPAVNVRIKTVTSLAIDLVAAQMATSGVTLISPRGGEILVDRIIHRLRPTQLSYLRQMDSSAGLAAAVFQSINDIRLAGVAGADIGLTQLEVVAKGQDLRTLAQAYALELKANSLIDHADLLRMAVNALNRSTAALPEDLVLLIPADIDLSFLEREFLQAFPDSNRQTLPIDEPATAGESAASDLELLRWLQSPTAAPPPLGDGTVRIRQAIGEVNEVRDVLRRCIAGQMRFDDVELLHTDSETYVPLVYETLCALSPEGETLGGDLPVTFAEGIPCRYSRPGRALVLWLNWIADDFPQRTLVQMIREGLLEVSGLAEDKTSDGRLSELLRGMGIGFGRDRYQTQLQGRIAGLQRQVKARSDAHAEDGKLPPDRLASLERQLQAFQTLNVLCERLLIGSPAIQSSSDELLAGAAEFLNTLARNVNQIDRFALLKLIDEIREMQHCLSLCDGENSFDAWDWLARLPNEARVLGGGPRPGCLHVAHLLSGGHTGRSQTFIVGLDDSRFPGSGQQDPLLLDSERRKLSPHLATAAARLEQRLGTFAGLLARLRGNLTLSFCTRSVDDDREMFPGGPALTAYRLISGKHDGNQSDVAAWLAEKSPPASFAPHEPDESLSDAEWWLWRLCGTTPVQDAEALVLAQYPHLAQGQHAAAQRRRREFTEYDGRVEQAGVDLDPTHSDQRVQSANRLQTIGNCPLRYFFEYGLDIAPPDDVGGDPSIWLDSLASGSLLHELFEKFMRELVGKTLIPNFERDEVRLREILADQVTRYRELYPVPSERVFQQQRTRLEQAALTFLREEAQHCAREGSRPVYLETSLGMPAEEHATPLDTLEAVPVSLAGQRRVWLRGRIDRIDLVGDGAVKTFAIWDYKTGSTWGYKPSEPFRQGRILQPYLYVTMITHRLRATVGPNSAVDYFGFFFPGAKARGERVQWTREALAAGQEILERLVDIVSSGAFLATNNAEDCNYCSHRGICEDIPSVVAASQAKLDHPENQLLIPMRNLRHG